MPWWSASVRQAIAKRKRSFRAYLRLRTDQTLVVRNRERADAKRIIRNAKRTSWQSFLSSFTSSTPLSKIWDLVRRLSGKRSSPTFLCLGSRRLAPLLVNPLTLSTVWQKPSLTLVPTQDIALIS